jgi:hypothetical protein
VPIYRLHDTTGDDLGLIEHPAPNVEPGDVVMLDDGREALVTARVEAKPGSLTALLEVAIAPTPLTSDESIVESRVSRYLRIERRSWRRAELTSMSDAAASVR